MAKGEPIEIPIKLGVAGLRQELKNLKGELIDLGSTVEGLQEKSAKYREEIAKGGSAEEIEKLNKALIENEKALANATAKQVELAEKTGMVSDRMKDVNEKIAVFASGSKFESVSNSLGLIGGQIASLDFEGANESAKTLVKLSKSITFADASKGVKDLISTFANLGKALLTNPMFLIAGAITLAVVAIVKLLDKMGVLKKIGEAIGYVFELIGDAIEYIAEQIAIVSDALFGTTLQAEKLAAETAERQNKELEKVKELTQRVSDKYNREANEARSLGKDTEDIERKKRETLLKTAQLEFDIYQERVNNRMLLKTMSEDEIKELKKTFSEAKKTLLDAKSELKVFNNETQKAKQDEAKKDNEQANQRAKEAAAKRKQFQAERLQAERQIQDLALQSLTDGFEKELKLNDEKYKRLIEDTKLNEKLLSGEKTKIIAEYEAQKVAEEEKIRMIENEKRLKLETDFQTKLLELQKTSEISKEEVVNQAYEKELTDLQVQLEAKTLTLDQFNQLEAQLLINKNQSLAQIEAENRKKELDTLLQLETTSNEQKKLIFDEQMATELANKDLLESEKLLIEQKYAKQKEDLDNADLERKKQIEAQKLGLASDGLTLISDLTELFGKKSEEGAKRAFNLNKAVGIAQTVISTFQAAQSAYASQLTIPSPDAPIRGAIAAGIAIASGLGRVAKIASTKFGGSAPASGGGASSGGSASSSASSSAPQQTPSTNLFGNANQFNNLSGAKPVEQSNKIDIVVKSVVVGDEITANQVLNKSIFDNSKLAS